MVLKRVVAYFIDILVVVFASSMLASISYLNPQLDKYNKVYNEYIEKYESLEFNNIDQNELRDINYQLDRSNIYGATISVVLTLLYFVVFQKYNNGQTLGKKLMKIKVDGNLSLFKYFIRTIILSNSIINVLKIAFILILSKEKYILISNVLYVLALLIEVTIIIMVTMRKDNRGLHDIVVGSNVIAI